MVARVRLALAVKKGAPKPDISTPAAVKKTLLDAKSITSVDPAQGSVGGIAQACLDKLGIADQVKAKFKWVRDGGIVQDSVAKGEVEIALGPYLSDMKNPGLDVAGPLPPGASTPVDITGFLSNSLKDTKDAKAFLAYLRSKEAAPIWEDRSAISASCPTRSCCGRWLPNRDGPGPPRTSTRRKARSSHAVSGRLPAG